MVEEMDSTNSSLKQARLPFKMLDTKSDPHVAENIRKRKLSDDDNLDATKCKKGTDLVLLCKYDDDQPDIEIENRPNITSSPKVSKPSKRLIHSYPDPVILSPLKRAMTTESDSHCSSQVNQDKEVVYVLNSNVSRNDKVESDVSVINSNSFVNHSKEVSDVSILNSNTSIQILEQSDMLTASLNESQNDNFKITKNSPNTSCIEISHIESVNDSVVSDSANEANGSRETDEGLSSCELTIVIDDDVSDKTSEAENLNIKKIKYSKSKKEEIKMERQKKRLEMKERKERERMEAKAKKDREKNEKLQHKIEKREREEKERLEKLKQKEERRQQKQLMLESKLMEKKKREEERQRKLEEKKRAEEERQKKMEEKRKAEEMQKMLDEKKKAEEEKKKQKAKAAFASFFVKTEPTMFPMVDHQEGLFLPFEITKDMKVAPPVPSVASEKFNREDFERLLTAQNEILLYINELKKGIYKPYAYYKQFRSDIDEIEDDVIVIDSKESEIKNKLHPKLLQFCENVRPPFWGTWRKKSKLISARNPFKKDDDFFDYDVDSDEEWEEGGPGESLSDTDDEKESDDDYEVDNDFFVPHGYLSEDEDGDENLSPETKRALLKMREKEFQDERNKKYSELKPEILGTFKGNGKIEWTEDLKNALEIYSPVLLTVYPIITTEVVSKTSYDAQIDSNNLSPFTSNETVQKSTQKQFIPEEAMPFLIRLVHANTLGRQTIIKEFQQFWQQHCSDKLDAETSKEIDSPIISECNNQNACSPQLVNNKIGRISKRQLEITFQKIAEWCKNLTLNKQCWWVHEEVRHQYNLTDLPVPNNWQYITPVKEPKKVINTSKATPSIKKYAKIITLT